MSSSAFLYYRHINEFECTSLSENVDVCVCVCVFFPFVIIDVIIIVCPIVICRMVVVRWRQFNRKRQQNHRQSKINCNTLYFRFFVCDCHNVCETLAKLIACINTFTVMPPPSLLPPVPTSSPQQPFPSICSFCLC